MFEIVQAPAETTSKGIKLFIAGGISNCPKWQDELEVKLISDDRFKEEISEDDDINIIIFNPRCDFIPEEEAQIKWEDNKLKQSNIVSFWFSEGSLNPITLFEYGKYLVSKKDLVVGCHPNYEKKNNVKIQTKIEKPDLIVNENFDDFYNNLVEALIDKITNYRIRNFKK